MTKRPEFNVEAAQQMRGAGMSWLEIATHYGRTRDYVQRRLDPDYLVRRRQVIRDTQRRRAARGNDPAVTTTRSRSPKPRPAEIAERLAEIPTDTRGLTARTMGDPLPGRSALDRKLTGVH